MFGVAVCVSKKSWSNSPTKCNHIVNVFYQLLDNDGDGVADDPTVLNYMVKNGYLLWVPYTDSDSGNDGNWPNEVGVAQMTGIYETVPNSCHVPSNRGADLTDRSTWEAVVDTDNSNSCSNDRDATTEEILHLITNAAGEIYPDLWGDTFKSEAGAALSEANGNCGWGYSNDWINPSSTSCTGHFAYDDKTCDERCNVVEGIYWASVSYIGGLYTKSSTDMIKREWLMATPDADMTVYPQGVTNAVSLETGSPQLYALVSDTTSEGHAWLPAVMPDGKYQGTPTTSRKGRKMLRTRTKVPVVKRVVSTVVQLYEDSQS